MSLANRHYMRGMYNFISEIRNCVNKKQEQRRVDKELAHIREKFTAQRISGYDKKKYVWKLIYIYMLGYPVEVGHMEALALLRSNKFSEKNAGYIACSVLLHENHELTPLLVQAVKDDITNHAREVGQCLALSLVANIGGQDLAESLTADVQEVLLSGKSRPHVKKKAALCLLRLFRKYPECIPPNREFSSRIIQLVDASDLGVSLCVMSLLVGLVSFSSKGYEAAVPQVVSTLRRLVHFDRRRISPYKYYVTMCPWLQVKCLKFLQYFNAETVAEQGQISALNQVLLHILNTTVMGPTPNKNNADFSIVWEAVNVIIHYATQVPDAPITPGGGNSAAAAGNNHSLDPVLIGKAVSQVSQFMRQENSNFKYIGLDSMQRLAQLASQLRESGIQDGAGAVAGVLNRHSEDIDQSLASPDISIRKRALDLLYAMCDSTNAKEIVERLLGHLRKASWELRETLVLKIAILAEKYATRLDWYLDVILRLISISGDEITDDIWYRAIQIVTNNPELQEYAARRCLEFLEQSYVMDDTHGDDPVSRGGEASLIHEAGIKVGCYILGEFGQVLEDIPPERRLRACLDKYHACNESSTQAMILSAIIKMANAHPELKSAVNRHFQTLRDTVDPEIQQRAVEYFALNSHGKDELMQTVFDLMPVFPEDRESLIIRRLKKETVGQTADRNVWEEDAERKETLLGDEHGDSDFDRDSDDSDASDFSEYTEEEEEEEEDPLELLHNSLRQGRGVLYQSEALQVGCQVESSEGRAKMILYFGNKTMTDFTNVRVDWEGEGGCADILQIQGKPSAPFDAQPFEIASRKQQMFLMMLDCLRPFSDTQYVRFSMQNGNRPVSLQLPVPVLLCDFCVPHVASKEEIRAAWQSTGNEIRKMLHSDDPSGADLAEINRVLQDRMHLFLSDADPNPNNVLAFGSFRSALPDRRTGQPLTMPILVWVTTKPGNPQHRVTVRSGHAKISEALLNNLSILSRARVEW